MRVRVLGSAVGIADHARLRCGSVTEEDATHVGLVHGGVFEGGPSRYDAARRIGAGDGEVMDRRCHVAHHDRGLGAAAGTEAVDDRKGDGERAWAWERVLRSPARRAADQPGPARICAEIHNARVRVGPVVIDEGRAGDERLSFEEQPRNHDRPNLRGGVLQRYNQRTAARTAVHVGDVRPDREDAGVGVRVERPETDAAGRPRLWPGVAGLGPRSVAIVHGAAVTLGVRPVTQARVGEADLSCRHLADDRQPAICSNERNRANDRRAVRR